MIMCIRKTDSTLQAAVAMTILKAYCSDYIKSMIPRSIPSMYFTTVKGYLSSVATYNTFGLYLWREFLPRGLGNPNKGTATDQILQDLQLIQNMLIV